MSNTFDNRRCRYRLYASTFSLYVRRSLLAWLTATSARPPFPPETCSTISQLLLTNTQERTNAAFTHNTNVYNELWLPGLKTKEMPVETIMPTAIGSDRGLKRQMEPEMLSLRGNVLYTYVRTSYMRLRQGTKRAILHMPCNLIAMD